MHGIRHESETTGEKRSYEGETPRKNSGTEEEAVEMERMAEATLCSRRLTEKLEGIKEQLREFHQEDQLILRRLLGGYQRFLTSCVDTQPSWSSTIPRQHARIFSDFSACAVSTNYRLELVRKFLHQKEDLNIREIANKLYPPIHMRTGSEPRMTLRHSNRACSLEESFLDTFSYDDEDATEMDPLSMSSIT